MASSSMQSSPILSSIVAGIVTIVAVGVAYVYYVLSSSDNDSGPFPDPPETTAASYLTVMARRKRRNSDDDDEQKDDEPPSSVYRIRYTDSGAPPPAKDTTPETAKNSSKRTSTTTTTTLILIHGFAGCLETWQTFTQQLDTEQFRVVALDLLGSGFSDKPVDGSFEYTFRNLGVLVADFVQELGLLKGNNDNHDIILVGHSSGGIVACAAAAELAKQQQSPKTTTTSNVPQRQGLFLVAPGFFQTKPALFSNPRFHLVGRLLARLLKGKLPAVLVGGHLNPEANLPANVQAAFEASWQTRHATTVLESMVVADEPPYVEVLGDIPPSVPLHIVWSEQDQVNPYAAKQVQQYLEQCKAKKVATAASGGGAAAAGTAGAGSGTAGTAGAAAVPPFSHALLSGAGHYIQHELPQQLVQELVCFCNRRCRQSSSSS